jgi:hypothetical protein
MLRLVNGNIYILHKYVIRVIIFIFLPVSNFAEFCPKCINDFIYTSQNKMARYIHAITL